MKITVKGAVYDVPKFDVLTGRQALAIQRDTGTHPQAVISKLVTARNFAEQFTVISENTHLLVLMAMRICGDDGTWDSVLDLAWTDISFDFGDDQDPTEPSAQDSLTENGLSSPVSSD